MGDGVVVNLLLPWCSCGTFRALFFLLIFIVLFRPSLFLSLLLCITIRLLDRPNSCTLISSTPLWWPTLDWKRRTDRQTGLIGAFDTGGYTSNFGRCWAILC
jgi:hypothetical protein